MHRRLPVTLVGGFLGAGKTSLLHHLITEHQGGHLALLVGTSGTLNPDAKALRGLCGAMRRTYDVVEEISFGDEAHQLEAIAHRIRDFANSGNYERVLIEVGGITNPARWAFYLQTECDRADVPVESLQLVCVVDLLDFQSSFLTAETSLPHALRHFQQAQIEGASVLVLNKCDLAGDEPRQKCTRLLRALNPTAQIIETVYGEVPPEIVYRPSPPMPWRSKVLTEDEELGALESVIYRARRPFHPARFWEWFNGDHPGLLRVKGLVWLATRNLLVGGVSRTALQNSCGAAGIWWAALPREEWPDKPEALAQMQDDWWEPYGDRRQELLLIGSNGLTGTAARHLNNCLLTDEEYARPLAEWIKLPDPFPAWDLED